MPTPLIHRGGRSTGRRRTAPLLAAGALLALAAAGCGDGTGPNTASGVAAAASPSSPSSPVQPAPSSAPSSVPSSGPADGKAPAGAPPTTGSGGGAAAQARTTASRCTVTGLRMRLGRADHGAGQAYFPLLFTNTSGHSCVLRGFPGVSLLRGDGSTIGTPAGREGPTGAAVRLAPGATVEADLHTLNQGIRGGGCWRAPTLLKAYPPGSKDAMTLTTSQPVVCGGTFEVGAVH